MDGYDAMKHKRKDISADVDSHELSPRVHLSLIEKCDRLINKTVRRIEFKRNGPSLTAVLHTDDGFEFSFFLDMRRTAGV